MANADEVRLSATLHRLADLIDRKNRYASGPNVKVKTEDGAANIKDEPVDKPVDEGEIIKLSEEVRDQINDLYGDQPGDLYGEDTENDEIESISESTEQVCLEETPEKTPVTTENESDGGIESKSTVQKTEKTPVTKSCVEWMVNPFSPSLQPLTKVYCLQCKCGSKYIGITTLSSLRGCIQAIKSEIYNTRGLIGHYHEDGHDIDYSSMKWLNRKKS